MLREILIIGAGNIFQTSHLPCFSNLGITIAGVVEPSTAVVNDLKKILPANTSYYTTIAEVDLSKIKYALVASPAGFHYNLIKELAKFNIHILCEKPIAITAAQANELYEIYTTNKGSLQIGFQRRFYPTNIFIKKLIADKTYGNLSHINIWGGWNAKGKLPQSILNKAVSGGGIMLDYGVHFTDTLLYWSNGIELVDYFDDNHGGIEVNAVSVFKLKLNQFVQPAAKAYYSWTNQMSNTIQLWFDDAMIISGVNNPTVLEVVRINNQIIDTRKVLTRETIDVSGTGYKGAVTAQWDEFFQKAEGTLTTPPISNLKDAVTAVNITEECYSLRKELTFNWGY